MKKILFFAISLFAVSAFAAGVVFKANPLALLQSGGGGEDKKAAKVEQAAPQKAVSNEAAKVSFQQVGLVFRTISIQKQYNLATGEVIHDFNAMRRSHVDEASKEKDDALFVQDLTELIKTHPEFMHDGIGESFKREHKGLFEQAKQQALNELPKGDKKQ